jgi:hypothetical protein
MALGWMTKEILSTPSLGITYNSINTAMTRMNTAPFNSLSRDH